MKILLVGNYENDGPNGSMQRFAALLAQGLADAGHAIRFIRPPAFFGQLHRSALGFGKWIGYVDKFAAFPLLLKRAARWADVVHVCDHSNSLYVDYLGSTPHAVTCHDLTAVRSALGEIPNQPTRWAGRQLQGWVTDGLKKAQHIVCVSEATRGDLLRITQVRSDRVSRVYNAMNHAYSRMEEGAARALVAPLGVKTEDRFFLQVGGNQWYKNRFGALQILAALRKLSPGQQIKLVMVGDFWTDEMRRFVHDKQLGDAALELGGINNEQLCALYSTASALLFPSLSEGFGWPIVEAQSCGCPVITSNRPPMDEVAGPAAIYIDPVNPDSAAQQINRYLFDGLERLVEPSLTNASRFDVDTMISGYIDVFNSLDKRALATN